MPRPPQLAEHRHNTQLRRFARDVMLVVKSAGHYSLPSVLLAMETQRSEGWSSSLWKRNE